MHTKITTNLSAFPITPGWAGKDLCSGEAVAEQGQPEEDHPQRKGTGGDNPCKDSKWKKRKIDDSLGIKREQLPQLLRPFCVPLKLFLKRRQAVRQMHFFTWLGICKFWPWQNLTATYSTKELWKGRGRWQLHNFAQRFLQIHRLGYQTGKAHSWAKTAINPFIWARSPWMPSYRV